MDSSHTHGTPGGTLLAECRDSSYPSRDRARGAFIEKATARALETWHHSRPDGDGIHIFHDLHGFGSVSGHGYGPLDVGNMNIDHLVLTGAMWLYIDSKGTGAGILAANRHGKGVLVKPDGSVVPQLWMDTLHSYSAAGVLVRLTGLTGQPVWVIPSHTRVHKSVFQARCFSKGHGGICTLDDVYEGELTVHVLPVPQPPAEPEIVKILLRYCDPA